MSIVEKLVKALERNGVNVIVSRGVVNFRASSNDVHICRALSAAADTGIIFFGGFEDKIRSGLAEHHIAILREEDVRDDVISAYKLATSKSEIVFASSSPSRTADVEGKLVRGVHGPKEMTVILEVRG